jgi:BirA family biotin operon repressor/biotin-[acetyl-CoA-carboxylase] ligase
MISENNEMSVTPGVGQAGWRLFEMASTPSTNDIAYDLPAWSAVRADEQSGGRGRFGRVFVSNPGGLWLSAVLPAGGGTARWAGFSLMVGNHLVRMIEALGIAHSRLRWPNDLMAGRKKLGGLLIEQSARETMIVGFGLNVSNEPWAADPSLEEIATSLQRESSSIPSLAEITILTLNALSDAHHAMEEGGLSAAIAACNERWRDPVAVELQLADGRAVHGRFLGLDPAGNLRIEESFGSQNLVAHQSVEKLVELL